MVELQPFASDDATVGANCIQIDCRDCSKAPAMRKAWACYLHGCDPVTLSLLAGKIHFQPTLEA